MNDDRILDILERLAIQSVAMTAAALAELGPGRDLTLAQWRALAVIATSDDLRASEIAARLGMSRPSMSRLATRLIRRGLVVSRPDPADGRAAFLTVTGVGRQLLVATRARRREMTTLALDGRGRPLPGDLRDGLDAITTALEGRP